MTWTPTFEVERAHDFERAGRDAFGHKEVAQVLNSAVRAAPSPTTIGLFGPWGSGKTSILLETRRLLSREASDSAFVIFDVWRYEGDSLRRAFLSDVSQQLKDGGWLKRSFSRDDLLKELLTDRTAPSDRIRLSGKDLGVALLWALVVFLFILGLLALLPELGVSDKNVERVYPAIVGATLAFALNALSKTLRVEQVQVRIPKLQDPDQFADRFRDLLRKGLKPGRLVLAVDNLDRCTPERVTELLATIKTFLEPTDAGKELVFVIAADDDALRRHLLAQELQATRHVGGDAEGQARVFVEEYLRKFFNIGLRVVDALDEEIHAFTRTRMAQFFQRHGVDAESEGDIVDMVSSALRRNPRRITQFVNNLEMRLGLILARENAGEIVPKVSGDIPLITKLLIIEEEFSEKYVELRQDPRLLANWHADASAPGEASESEADASFNVFLRSTDGVSSAGLRAVIDLKQGADERSLPRYREFTTALDEGSASQVEVVLVESPELAAAYAAAIPRHFQRQLQRSTAEALNTVRVVVGLNQLSANTPRVTRPVLDRASLEPRLRSRLAQISPSPLLDAAATCQDVTFNRIVLTLARSVEEHEQGADQAPPEVGRALAPHATRLNGETRAAVRRAYESEAGRAEYDDILAVSQADLSLLPSNALSSALASTALSGRFKADEPAYQVAALATSGRDGSDLLSRVVAAIAATIEEGEPDDGARLADDTTGWFPASELSESARESAIQNLDALVPRTAGGTFLSVARLFLALFSDATAALVQGSGPQAIDRVFDADESQAMMLFASIKGELPAEMRGRFAERLERLASREVGVEDEWNKAAELLASEPDASTRVANAVILAYTQQRIDATTSLVGEHRDVLAAPDVERIVDAVLGNAATFPAPHRGEALRPVLEFSPTAVGPDRMPGVQSLAVAGLQDPEQFPGVFTFMQAARSRPDWSGFRQDVVVALAEWVRGLGTNAPSYQPQLSLIVAERDVLGQPRREALADALCTTMQAVPEHASALASPVKELVESATSDRRRDFVSRLLAVEQLHPTPVAREAALRAANALAGPHGRARDAVRDRLQHLSSSGDDFERALANELLRD